MANTIRCNSSQAIQNVFDLKGSVINREVKITKKIKNTSTLKDVNLQRVKRDKQQKIEDFIKFKRSDIDKIKE